ncbi:MAG: hypothetical protein IPO24_20495 [Bacteroidetes bacterium]|nr:hypothetical protein [Bacteroidota bacterium]
MKIEAKYQFTSNHHDPFGMLLEGRSWEGGSEYRFGFNGKEGVDEIVVSNNAFRLRGEGFMMGGLASGLVWTLSLIYILASLHTVSPVTIQSFF